MKRKKIIIDTREQTPWLFSYANFDTRRAKLEFGDYAIEGAESRFAIERKTLDDFVGSITSGRERFWREFERAREAGARVVVIVEANADDVAHHDYTSAVSPAVVSGAAIALWRDFGVHVVFAGCRANANILAEQWLRIVANAIESNESKIKHESEAVL